MISYIIQLKGHLDERWEILFDGFSIHHRYTQNGQPITEICGPISDPAEMYGLISRLRDIGADLISLRPENE
jgi:hypothetical protein